MSGRRFGFLPMIAAFLIGFCPASQAQLPDAPSGFDDSGIEPDPMNLHVTQDKKAFDKVDLKNEDGLGPIYNAQSCRECHQNPVSGAGSQITELRVGHMRNGVFQNPSVPIIGDVIKGRTLINDRAICVEAQEHVPPGNEIRTRRLSLSILETGLSKRSAMLQF
jgi:hypothetical protein